MCDWKRHAFLKHTSAAATKVKPRRYVFYQNQEKNYQSATLFSCTLQTIFWMQRMHTYFILSSSIDSRIEPFLMLFDKSILNHKS